MTTEAPAAGERQRRQAELEEERDFLLRSLDDLDAEREAGDLDEADYRALKDDYTARAATVLRRLQGGIDRPDEEAGSAEDEPAASSPVGDVRAGVPGRRARWPLVLSVVATLALAGGSGYLVTRTSGERLPGDEVTAGPDRTTRTMLQQAIDLDNTGKVVEAAKLYDAVLAEEPENVVALTRRGWLLGRSGRQAGSDELLHDGLRYLDQATKVNPSYADAHAFRGLVLGALARPGEAVCELRAWLAVAPITDGQRPAIEEVLDEAVKRAGPDIPQCPKPPVPEPVAADPRPAGPAAAP